MLNARLIYIATLVISIASAAAYIYWLRTEVSSLKDEVKEKEEQVAVFKQQVINLTASAEVAEKKRKDAEEAAALAGKRGVEVRTRVERVTIPSTCDGAMEWLRNEVSR